MWNAVRSGQALTTKRSAAAAEVVAMAIFDLDVRAINRGERSATAAAAYRAGVVIHDERTGALHDYRRRGGVLHSEIVLPASVAPMSREVLWNQAEAAERRCDAKVAREVRIALPAELDAQQRQRLAQRFAAELVTRYGVAADVAIHKSHRAHRTQVAPGVFVGGDPRNHHAHIMLTTRAMGVDGALGAKTRVLDSPRTSAAEVRWIRQRWAELANEALAAAEHDARIDQRSLRARGVDRAPQVHLGPAPLAIARRRGRSRAVDGWLERRGWAAEAERRLTEAAAAAEAERQANDAVEQATRQLEQLRRDAAIADRAAAARRFARGTAPGARRPDDPDDPGGGAPPRTSP